MSQSTDERLRWTTSDLDLLPDNGNRYEIIDGELFVSTPHWEHQVTCGNIYTELKYLVETNWLGTSRNQSRYYIYRYR